MRKITCNFQCSWLDKSEEARLDQLRCCRADLKNWMLLYANGALTVREKLSSLNPMQRLHNVFVKLFSCI